MEIVINKNEKIFIISISGEFHVGNVVKFKSKWNTIVEDKPEIIAINCSGIAYIDSTALGTLIHFLKFLTTKDIDLVLIDLSFAVEAIFKTTKIDKFFTITTKEKLKFYQ